MTDRAGDNNPDYRCEPLENTSFDEAAELARSFMDEEDALDFARIHFQDQGLDLVCRDALGRVVGVCYGAVNGSHATVRMISMKGGYAGHGLGSQLLQAFEEACLRRGCASIGLGSGPEAYVEHFYLKNGYEPVEYYIAMDAKPGEHVLEGLEVLRPRYVGGRFFVNVKADGYDPGRKEELRQRLNPSSIGYVFQKQLRSG